LGLHDHQISEVHFPVPVQVSRTRTGFGKLALHDDQVTELNFSVIVNVGIAFAGISAPIAITVTLGELTKCPGTAGTV
jgi:hypothetical protein